MGQRRQEPKYGSRGVLELMDAVAISRVPCMSIMNMPPLPYMRRIPGLDSEPLKPAYTSPAVWDVSDPGALTLCSPDPQPGRPPGEESTLRQGALRTTFKGPSSG